jgi:two-component system chemotaxis response regulator CheY
MATRVLIVDDDRAIRRLVKAFLASERSFEVIGEAENCAEAFEVAGADPPDLVTMDFEMPGGNGAECIRAMKARWPDVHILGLTSAGREASRAMLDAGAFATIDKSHMELVIPSAYQVVDEAERERQQAENQRRSAQEPQSSSSHYEQLRTLIATMEAEAAEALEEQKKNIDERLELIVVLKAILVASSNPNYSPDEALDEIASLVRSILESEEDDGARVVKLRALMPNESAGN